MKQNSIKQQLFGDVDFTTLADNPNFKEDSVREVVILPILYKLGYNNNDIVRSKALQHPVLKIGSQRRQVTLVPDYVLKVEDNFAWVLDAKAPTQKIVNNDNVEQVYSYAYHPEIRSPYFALCNGVAFALFRTSDTNQPVLYFELADVDNHWEQLLSYLSPDSFHTGKTLAKQLPVEKDKKDFDYKNRPFLKEIPVKKQASRRHFGVHGYFTKQTWNVVAEYIKNYTQKGDLVVDPYGGSGVTAIEAVMNGRKSINIDINPMANFLVEALVAPVKESELISAFDEVKKEYLAKEPKTKEDIKKALKKYSGPKKLALPKDADVRSVDLLFTDEQTAKLALLKYIINKQKNEAIRKSLLLMFSGMVSRYNLTFHGTATRSKDVDGLPSVFRYSRYRIAPHPTEIDFMKIFNLRLQKVCLAKKEMEIGNPNGGKIDAHTIKDIQVVKGTATDLSFINDETVDYIYTDPPYGKHIAYLDLSAMWNAWLDLDVTQKDYELEAIEGGEQHKTKEEYKMLIAQSIREMYRVLKFDRWLSFVFAHKDPEFWHLIIDTAEKCGFEYVGAVAQKNGRSHFKKHQYPLTVLSGELIINFRKVKNPKTIMKAHIGMDITELVMQTIEGIIAKHNGATIEQINDEIIIKGLELGFLDLLRQEYTDLTALLKSNFDYDETTETYTLRKDTRFTSHLDVRLRIKYYMTAYLLRTEREGKTPNFDEIVLHILPLLKNGATPENQTILSVLESIGERINNEGWRLKKEMQTSLFEE
jgi:16S rRNA G966 N2-methylase RsmD